MVHPVYICIYIYMYIYVYIYIAYVATYYLMTVRSRELLANFLVWNLHGLIKSKLSGK